MTPHPRARKCSNQRPIGLRCWQEGGGRLKPEESEEQYYFPMKAFLMQSCGNADCLHLEAHRALQVSQYLSQVVNSLSIAEQLVPLLIDNYEDNFTIK